MVFQDALSALNPVLTVGWQIAEMFRVHGHEQQGGERGAVELMDRVRIPAARRAPGTTRTSSPAGCGSGS